MRILLADLGHNQMTMSSDVYPLGVANLASYVQGHLGHRVPLDITLFREPEDLKKALEEGEPDVLGLSSYSWNHELSSQFAVFAKRKHPGLLTLMGGPNFPLTRDEQEEFLRELPDIDVAVRGPTYEGERAFLNILERYAEVGGSIEGLWEEAVPGNVWIDRKADSFVAGEDVKRIRDLDEIPSPYLGGWMDPFFDTGYFPLLQIARGCPFSCAFCNSSVLGNSKIHAHSRENVERDLLYVAERVKPEIPLCFADDNFGMYKLDEGIADYIAWLQDTYGWPQYIRTTTGKNRHERIIRVMRKTRGVMPMTSAVQSMNPEVLENIKRSNISLDAYAAIQEEVKAQGLQAYGELILCLPGETMASAMKAFRDLMQSGVSRVSAHQLMLLHGAPLANPDSRERWDFKTRWRVVARNIGHYLEEPTIEVEEIVVQTSTFSFHDYLDARVFHLLLTIFYYEGNYEEAFEFARQHGVEPFDLVVRLQEMLTEAPEKFQAVVRDFVMENEEELFDSKEECIAWAQQNFDGLRDGTLGGNLLSKHSMIGRFYTLHESLEFLQQGILTFFEDEAYVPQFDAVIGYLSTVMLHTPFEVVLNEEPRWDTMYDVEKWREDGYEAPLNHYAFSQPRVFETIVEPDRKARLETRLKTFGEHPGGLGKFTRTMFARDLRRTVV